MACHMALVYSIFVHVKVGRFFYSRIYKEFASGLVGRDIMPCMGKSFSINKVNTKANYQIFSRDFF